MSSGHLDHLRRTLDRSLASLVEVEHFAAGSLVTMPVLYPGGGSVVLDVLPRSNGARITDRGEGFRHAELSGNEAAFSKSAERIAGDLGLVFDGRDILLEAVPIDRITGAMVMVANASAQASHSAMRAPAREAAVRDAMFGKLESVFGPGGFEKHGRILGASNHRWTIDASVRHERGFVVFNAVTGHYVSAAGTAAKFHDLGTLEHPPARIAVVVSRQDLGDWYGVVAAASDAVLETVDPNDRFRGLLAAA